MTDIVERAREEAALCRAETADDVATLLDELADEITRLAQRKVKPLTEAECALLVECANTMHYYTNSNLRAKFEDIMAARGIEVGE